MRCPVLSRYDRANADPDAFSVETFGRDVWHGQETVPQPVADHNGTDDKSSAWVG